MKFLSHASLRQMLTVPYVVLVLVAAASIGFLSYDAGSSAVDNLSDLVLSETVGRISQAVDKHVSGSEAVLDTAFPPDMPAPKSIVTDLDALRQRFWLATTVHLEPNNYAYYGNRSGQFIGLWRFSKSEAELRLRTESEGPRSIYQYSTIRGELKSPVPETRIFDPRDRPWYKAGQGVKTQTWTSIYIDFKTLNLVGTRARRVNGLNGEFEGVVATDLSLQHLNDFLKTLPLTKNGVAFIAEPDGNLIATSRGPHLGKGAVEGNANMNTRLNAADSQDPVIVATYQAVRELMSAGGNRPELFNNAQTGMFVGPDGVVQAGYARLRDQAGLDWIVAVAVPRQDFMQKVTNNVQRTVWLALLACAVIVGIGMFVLNQIAGDLRQLAVAANGLGDGIVDAKIPVERTDEIGALAKSFAAMQSQLFTDKLTGIANREAVMRRIEDRIIRQRRRGDGRPFAVLFIDLNGFKLINDSLGHDVGDRALIEIAHRLTHSVRDVDLAARFGGDEFVVVLEDVASLAGANAARSKLERQLAEPLACLQEVTGVPQGIRTGASIGLALCPADGADIDTLLKHADQDMYTRKQGQAQGAV